jgi:hypothetical protein
MENSTETCRDIKNTVIMKLMRDTDILTLAL